MTLLNEKSGHGDRNPGVAVDSQSAGIAVSTAELQIVRSGPELDESRTAPIAIVGAGGWKPVELQQSRFLSLANLLRSGGVQQVADLLAVAALITALATGLAQVVVAVAVVALVAAMTMPRVPAALLRGHGPTGAQVVPRIVIAAAPVLVARDAPGVTVSALLASAVLLEPLLARVTDATTGFASNLPGLRVPMRSQIRSSRAWVVTTLLVVVVAVGAVAGVPMAVLIVPAAVAACSTAVILAAAMLVLRAQRRAELLLPDAMAAYAPRFALHWDAPPGTEYQLLMWLPYLERIGEPFVVIVRNPKAFAGIAAATDRPLLVRRDPKDLDAVVAPTMSTIFYVNNAARNTHFVRFAGLTHVQLNHGESDKAPSYSPVFRLYDRDFVAGQAAIDRFAAHGVNVPESLFTIVGRPQVEHVAVGPRSTGRRTALYAPTWGGANTDSDYCSLPVGCDIVTALLQRGYEVIFRPHPYTWRYPQHGREADRIIGVLRADAAATGRRHRFGPAATQDMTTVECFNAADLLISDVSSIVPDWLWSEKPFAIVSMQAGVREFVRTFPIAKAAYVLDDRGRNIDFVLDSMTTTDPLAGLRVATKRYFLGDFPAEGYAEVFVHEARKVVAGR